MVDDVKSSGTVTNPFVAEAAVLTNLVVAQQTPTATTSQSGQTWTFTFSPTADIPIGSVVYIDIPTCCQMTDGSNNQITKVAISG